MKLIEITKIPSEDLCATNVRKNCLILDVFWWIISIPHRILKMIKDSFSERINSHLNEFIDFLNQIEGENILINENNEDRAQILNVIQNFVINREVIFDRRYNKLKGEFGLRFSVFGLINFYKDSTEKNGKQFFYPNENCEGYGLRINNNEDIFNGRGREWCMVYKNLMSDEINYRINGISGNIIEKRNNDGTLKQIKIFYQCRIRQESLLENLNGTLIFTGGPNDIIPYRIIKENLSSINRWQFNI